MAPRARYAISCSGVTTRLPYIVLMLALVSTGSGSRPHAQTDRFALPDDLEITLWAESPMFFNPTNIDIDVRGRVWVAEAVNYRDFNTAKQSPLTHQAGDRILILTDTNGDGRADQSKVFVQDKDLRAPLGLAVIGNRVIVSASPHLIVYTDENGDDKPDKKEILLSGFGGYDHDHGLHALVAGPDGRWYFNTGNAGPHVVTDRSRKTIRAGSLYTGGTPYNLKNEGGLVSDDGRVWTGGLGLRMEPDGTRLTVAGAQLSQRLRARRRFVRRPLAERQRRSGDGVPHDLVDGGRERRLLQRRRVEILAGRSAARAGYVHGALASGRSRRAACRRQHWRRRAGWRGSPRGRPARPALPRPAPQRGRRTERDLRIPSAAARRWLHARTASSSCRVSARRTRTTSGIASTRTGASGSGQATSPSALTARSTSPTGTTRSSAATRCTTAKGYGRIYRVTPKGRALRTPSIDLRTTAGQVQALLSPAVNVRSSGYERLKAQGAAALPAVKSVLADPNPFHRARAIWLLAELGPDGVREVEQRLADTDPQIRVAAFRALRRAKASVLAEARALSQDPSPAVRREVALSLRGIPFEDSRDIFQKLAAAYDGVDRWYLEALGIAAWGNEDKLYSALLPTLGDPDPLRWERAVFSDRVAPAHGNCSRRLSENGRSRARSPLPTDVRRWLRSPSSTIPQAAARDGGADAQRLAGRRRTGGVVDDVSEGERLARLSGRGLGPRARRTRSRPRSTRV